MRRLTHKPVALTWRQRRSCAPCGAPAAATSPPAFVNKPCPFPNSYQISLLLNLTHTTMRRPSRSPPRQYSVAIEDICGLPALPRKCMPKLIPRQIGRQQALKPCMKKVANATVSPMPRAKLHRRYTRILGSETGSSCIPQRPIALEASGSRRRQAPRNRGASQGPADHSRDQAEQCATRSA
jgi:hypothetical protein